MRARSLAAALGLAAAAAPLLAAEGGGGPFEGNVGNALWTLVVFGLVVLVLGRYAWGPILSGLAEREQFIRSSLEEARRDREAAAKKLEEYVEQLNRARSEATAIVEEARRDAEAVRRRIGAEAQAEAQQTLERARREIRIAQETAVKELYTVAARVSTEVTARILAREISGADHERLIREAIARLQSGAN
jgi:F-type H+-transporting ATPase subunit b